MLRGKNKVAVKTGLLELAHNLGKNSSNQKEHLILLPPVTNKNFYSPLSIHLLYYVLYIAIKQKRPPLYF